jgi:hypothetical protein
VKVAARLRARMAEVPILARLDRLAALVTLGLWVASSRPVFALCPNCLGQARLWTARQELLGAFLLFPFLTAWLAARLIRRFSGPPTQPGAPPAER